MKLNWTHGAALLACVAMSGCGMIGGGGMVFVWKLLVRPFGGVWNVYELLPAFIFSCLCIIVVSLLTAPPSDEIQKEFDEVKAGIDC